MKACGQRRGASGKACGQRRGANGKACGRRQSAKAIGPVPILDGGPVGRGKSKWVKVPGAKVLVSRVTATRVFTVFKLFVFVFAKEVLRRILGFKFSVPAGPPRRQKRRRKDVRRKEKQRRDRV